MSNVIRGGNGGGQAFQFGAVEEEGKRLLLAAKEAAARLILEAKAEAAKVRQGAADEGRKAGREQGLAEGKEQGRKEGKAEALATWQKNAARIQQVLVQLGRDVETGRRTLGERAHADLVELAMVAVRKIVGATAQVDPSVVRENMKHAVGLVLERSRLRVKVHPEDRAILEELAPLVVKEYSTIEAIDLVSDPATGRGGVVVEGQAGRIDATITSQLERLEKEILGKKIEHPAP